MDCGVPQGSIGGPLLWLCFTVDQPDVVHNHSVERDGDNKAHCVTGSDCGQFVGYVDDGGFSYSDKDPINLANVLSSKFGQMRSWMTNNKLVINPAKTHLMVFGSKNSQVSRNNIKLTIDDVVIAPSASEKLLGGVISQDLKWNTHIRDGQNSLMTQLTGRINGLKRVARNSTYQTRKMVANGIVLSKLVYLINLWGGAQTYLLKALYVQQMVAARTVCGFESFNWSNRRVLERIGWLSLRQLSFYHTVLQVHRILVTKSPSPLYHSLISVYPYNTRSAVAGNIRFGDNFRSEQLSFRSRARLQYNQVPIEVRTGSLDTVKKKLKHWIKLNVPIDWG